MSTNEMDGKTTGIEAQELLYVYMYICVIIKSRSEQS